MLQQTLVSELSRSGVNGEIGRPMVACPVLDQTVQAAGALYNLQVPFGQVFLITDIHIQADTLTDGLGGAFTASPDSATYGIAINDQSGTAVSNIEPLAFRRWQQTFEIQNSPNWRNTPPDNICRWTPKYPIPVPAGWTVKPTIGGAIGNGSAIYGYFVGEDAARTAGYKVTHSSSPTTVDCGHGVKTAISTASAADMIAARTGKSIRILDMWVRIQPSVAGSTNKVTLTQTSGETIFSWTNNNPIDMKDFKISPDIFLRSGQALRIVSGVALAATVTVSFEYVDEKEIPGDHFWAYAEPDLPTPSTTSTGSTDSFRKISTQLTCYYPRYPTLTKTSPLTGYQHVVRGWSVNSQKNTRIFPDQTLFALSTGTAGGNIEFNVGGTLTQTNYQLSQVYANSTHDQCLIAVADNLNLPCKKDDGSIWFDTLNLSGATAALDILQTPTPTDADIDEWSVTVWGRTIPTKWYNPSNQGT